MYFIKQRHMKLNKSDKISKKKSEKKLQIKSNNNKCFLSS